jgi:hypothetical protein
MSTKKTQYIVNLTNDLITRNRYDGVPKKDFLEVVADDLERRDVAKMNPATLGKILCSIESGDVLIGKAELLGALHFSGDCDRLLRELVARVLAQVIKDRLENEQRSTLPLYTCNRRSPFARTYPTKQRPPWWTNTGPEHTAE